jgi:hypothetical protein
MGSLLIMDDGPIAILFIIGFFALVVVLAKLSKTKPKYRQRTEIDIAKKKEIEELKKKLRDLEK